jgi:hypothetical protein
MNLLKRAYYNACSVLPPSLVQRISPVKTLLPYHHLVSDKELLHIKHLYSYKNTNQFKSDIDYLLKYFKPATVDELVDRVNKKKTLPPGTFLLTFDDGFKEVYEVIAPILSSRKIPAIFFINPAFIDNKELFYRCKISLLIEELSKRSDALEIASEFMEQPFGDFLQLKTQLKKITQLNKSILDSIAESINYSFSDYLENEKPFMTTEQVEELSKNGFVIGSHSWDHPYYEYLSAEEQINQTIQSMKFVKDKALVKYSCFSFPHTDAVVTQDFFDRMNSEPVKPDILFGIQNQKKEEMNKVLHRFNAERPEVTMRSQVNGILLYSLMQKALGRNTIHRI